MQPVIEASAGPLRGLILYLPPGEITLGRDADNVLCLNDATISRRHCAFSREGDFVTVRDLGSRNRTLVNGRPAEAAVRLESGDEITAGAVSFRYSVHAIDINETVAMGVLDSLGEAGRGEAGPVVLDLAAMLQFSASALRARSAAELERLASEALRPVLPEASVTLLDSRGASKRFDEAATAKVSRGETLMRRADGAVSWAAPLASRSTLGGILLVEAPDTPDDPAGTRVNPNRVDRVVRTLALLTSAALENIDRLELAEQPKKEESPAAPYGIVGNSPPVQRMLAAIRKAGPTNSTVLITGESGTGKELVARALHEVSNRRDRPFIAVNCAAIPEALLEGELFGHQRGAFTGATAARAGRFERAAGGAIFLDEIGELPLPLQSKLLRVVQDHEIERLGSTGATKIDIRVLTATNRDLTAMVAEGTFRLDLFHRLSVITVRAPSLRDRAGDIPLLAAHFLDKCAAELHRPRLTISAEALAALEAHTWPGNVRELANAIERAAVFAEGSAVSLEDLPEDLWPGAPGSHAGAYHEAVRSTKVRLITEALRSCGGNVSSAAAALGLNPTYLHRLISNLQLRERGPSPRNRRLDEDE